jgi:hypothetical protein
MLLKNEQEGGWKHSPSNCLKEVTRVILHSSVVAEIKTCYLMNLYCLKQLAQSLKTVVLKSHIDI